MIKGYLDFYKNKIKAVILNNVSKHLYKTYKEMIEDQLGIFVAGYMPYEPDVTLGSRHLGLITAKEIDSLKQKLDLLSSIAEETIDIDLLIDIAKNSEPFDYEDIEIKKICDVKIAVAKDRAFCFYYQDSLDLLEKMGAKLEPFSPSEDHKLSEVDGLIIGGGYPELYLEKLSNNKEMLNSMKDAAITGMPIFAECGGFMYLGKSIGTCSMAGILDLSFEMTDRLQNFGYVTLTAKENTELLECGESAYAHEYHYSKDNSKSGCLTAKMQSGKTWEAGCCKDNVFALYPHIHFWGNIGMAERFVLKCEEYRKNKEMGMTGK
jgi:cobyrinic acid a,c-diamide synthase